MNNNWWNLSSLFVSEFFFPEEIDLFDIFIPYRQNIAKD